MTIPPPPDPTTRRRGVPTWGVALIVAGALLVAFVFSVGGGLGVFVMLLASAATIVAAVGLSRPLPRLSITSRGRAGALLAVALIAVVIGATDTGVTAARTTAAGQPAHRSLAAAPTATPAPSPSIEVRQLTETTPIPHGSTTAQDPNRDVGQSAITTTGVDGVTTTTYTATLVDGVEASRVKTGEQVTTPPIDEVTSVGTRQPAPPPKAQPVPLAGSGGSCNTNYANACVPDASDVDCAGGSGDGPAYLSGQARVVGRDVYDLDRDHDGIACD